ncbi:hypothetical protein [Brachyspira hampsonii]|uniref:hypothetical protein n=1 Tax=Brachyspira hampsonii TaxID=1287055 RepID=UPI000A66D03A|nr:hypothetical protein [Brachyspira hampsonii]
MIPTYGGFEIDVKQKNNISEELKDIFEKGTHLLGARRELMLYLGKQVVHGLNLAFISRSVPATLNPLPYYELIIININETGKTCIVRRETILKSSESAIGGIICSKEDEAPIRIINSTEANNPPTRPLISCKKIILLVKYMQISYLNKGYIYVCYRFIWKYLIRK